MSENPEAIQMADKVRSILKDALAKLNCSAELDKRIESVYERRESDLSIYTWQMDPRTKALMIFIEAAFELYGELKGWQWKRQVGHYSSEIAEAFGLHSLAINAAITYVNRGKKQLNQ